MPTDNFQWTDELVYEYVCYLRNGNPKGLKSDELLKQFKQSKQQSNKDWEIIDCISYAGGDPHKYNEEICFSGTKPCTIHSVRRLSDNEVFTVGDEVKTSEHGDRWVIKKIGISEGNGDLYFESVYGICTFLKGAIKQKQPLFRSENGIDIYEGDSVSAVNSAWAHLISYNVNREEYENRKDHCKFFSTPTQAKQYILYNKPCLSLNDIITIKESNGYLGDGLIRHLTELANEKVNNK